MSGPGHRNGRPGKRIVFGSLTMVGATTLFSAAILPVDRGPRALLGGAVGNSPVFVAFGNVGGFALLLAGVFRFGSAGHGVQGGVRLPLLAEPVPRALAPRQALRPEGVTPLACQQPDPGIPCSLHGGNLAVVRDRRGRAVVQGFRATSPSTRRQLARMFGFSSRSAMTR